MSLCALCGIDDGGYGGLCLYHHAGVEGEGWSANNKVLCDFFHRHIEPARVEVGLRDDEWALSA